MRPAALPASIVWPGFFMDNFTKPALRALRIALMRAYIPRARPLQVIAAADIGKWVVRTFADPVAFIGKRQAP